MRSKLFHVERACEDGMILELPSVQWRIFVKWWCAFKSIVRD